tara:strand:+ start:1385 stop:2716 length:1332 start_codon:yes stop_codon:yes gene_type:complete
MSKSSSEGLFGVTLTELVIILFFIMLLLAIFNIDNITKEKEEAENELIVIKEKTTSSDGQSVVLPKITWDIFVDLIWGESEGKPINSDLVPVRDFEEKLEEIMFNTAIIEEENKKLVSDNEMLTEKLESLGADPDQMPDPKDGTGNCGTGFWITGKCSDHCWEIDSTDRKYDYLLDIGVCESSIVVQRSEWLQKNESDFILVGGAVDITNKKYMKKEELYQFLDIIKQPGFIKEPKQCFHSVNIIDLAGVSAARFDPIELGVGDRVSRRPIVDPSRKSYQEIRSRFSDDACNLYIDETINYQTNNKTSDDDRTPQRPKRLDRNDSSRSLDEVPVSSGDVVMPSMDNKSFNNAFGNLCRSRNVGRTSEVSIEYSIELDKRGRAVSVELTINNPDLKGPELRLNNLGISALKKTSFKPKLVNGVPVKSFLTKKVKFPKNVCSSNF